MLLSHRSIELGGVVRRRVFGRIAALIAFAIVCLFMVSLVCVRAEDARTADVHIDNFSFTPAELIVAPGTTVTWTNRDDIPHTVVEKSVAWRSKALDTDDSFSHTFGAIGEFEYFCSLHPHMKAKIIVKAP
jgi:plastocyanin